MNNWAMTIGLSALLLSGCITTLDGKKTPKASPKVAAESYLALGVAYMEKGRYDLAEPKLQRSIQANPSAEAYNALALLYEETHNNQLAEDTYKQLIAQFPDYGRGYLNYHIFLCQYDRTKQIADLALRMSARGKSIAAIGQISAGNCALSKGDDEAASSHYRSALQYEKYAAGALLPLAEISLKKGQFETAQQYVDTVNNYIGYSAQSLYLSAVIAKAQGNAAEERKMVQELQRRFPNTPEANKLKN